MTVRVRIAPSPTGNLHIGTARTAVFNWLFARHTGGTFILRVEDTDLERSKPEYTENIQSGLQWLGLNWDEGPFFQTQRLDHYRQAIQKLLDQGLAYRCYCTSEELEQMREAQKANNQAPRYDNRHRNLSPEQEAAFLAEGRQPVIRFRIDDDRQIIWQDQIRGQMVWQGSDLGGDMVIARTPEKAEDGFGQPLYNLAVVVDDIDMAITHVIRGEDHIANTAKQILLYEALGATVPTFAHTPLILNQEGKKLSKRDGVTSIDDFRSMGFLPQAIANYMCLLGWTPPDSTQEIFTLAEAAEQFSLERVNKAGAKFDWQKLDWINSQYLHALPAAELMPLLIPYLEAGGYQVDLEKDQAWLESLASLIGPSLTRLTDAATESQLLFGDRLDLKEDGQKQLAVEGAKAVLEAALTFSQNMPELTLDEAKGEINRLTKELGLKKGVVMKSLRAGLMGTVQGPDLLQSWLLLHQKGWATTRLNQAIAQG
ncbi:glutamate--tRNA ligase [Synechocystis sp. PCC 7339]|uniref:glutamate--tRNA ligase n=1 Tax=unclassified Synechocystis TaxID=2640012 RepID=UPI001BB09D40|nr:MULTISPECIES: glutamate--tRNA ligase [unclassified Synechocystis]QUS59615.1 glutamate--tRNA ligase [Synechocystis sp. PCC 7338]UAJ71816.1 glutamate--tRNA ligase [Synechocystis sp. PCC 7339]